MIWAGRPRESCPQGVRPGVGVVAPRPMGTEGRASRGLVSTRLRGTGAAGRLMAALSADIRAKDLKITPICGYAAAWLRRSKEFGDLTR